MHASLLMDAFQRSRGVAGAVRLTLSVRWSAEVLLELIHPSGPILTHDACIALLL